MAGLAWFAPYKLIYAAGGPLLSLVCAYAYFAYAATSKQFFSSYNSAKSIVLSLIALETYRQVLISIKTVSGISLLQPIQTHCGDSVDTLAEATQCAGAVLLTLVGHNALLWLVPALVLELISNRIAHSRVSASEA